MKRFIFLILFFISNRSLQATEARKYFGLTNLIYSKVELTKFDNNFYNKNNSFLSLNSSVRWFYDDFFIGLTFDLNLNSAVRKEEYFSNDNLVYKSFSLNINEFFNTNFIVGYNFSEKYSLFGAVGLSYSFVNFEYNYVDAHSELNDDDNTISNLKSGINVIAGLIYNVTENLELLLYYKFSTFNIKERTEEKYYSFIDIDTNFTTNSIAAGFNYIF